MEQTRRSILKGSAGVTTLGITGLAGCVDSDEPATDPASDGDGGVGADDTDDVVETETVSFLVEGVSGHDHDHDHDHDDEHDDHDDDHDHHEDEAHHDEDDHDHDDEHDDHDHDDEHDDHDHEDDHDHDHDDEHDHDHDHDVTADGLSEHDIGHACDHLEFGEHEAIEAGTDEGTAPRIDETHQPYDVTVTDGRGYLVFEVPEDEHDHEDEHDDHDDEHDDDHDHHEDEDHHDEDDHDHDEEHDDHDHEDDHDDEHDHDDHDHELFAFFSGEADIEVVTGEEKLTTEDDEFCEHIGPYVIAEPDHGEVVLRISA